MKFLPTEKSSVFHASGYSRSSAAFSLSKLLATRSKNHVLILCSSDEEAEQWHKDLSFFAQFLKNEWSGTELFYLSGWEQSPYRLLQPTLTARYERLNVLYRISQNPQKNWVTVATIQTFLQAAPEKSFLEKSLKLRVGMNAPMENIENELIQLGYIKSASVEDPGTFAIRGGILDVCSPSEEHPMRVEFWDDVIDSIRFFNADSQRSIRALGKEDFVAIIPCRDFDSSLPNLHKAREKIKEWSDKNDISKSARERVNNLLGQGVLVPEMDYYIPFFQEKQTWVSDLLPSDTIIFIPEPDDFKSRNIVWETKEGEGFHVALQKQIPLPPPENLFQDLQSALTSKNIEKIVEVNSLPLHGEEMKYERLSFSSLKGHADIDSFISRAKKLNESGVHVVFVANSISQTDRLTFLLNQHKLRVFSIETAKDLSPNNPLVCTCLGTISESLILLENKIAFISEDHLFGQKSHSKNTAKSKAAPVIVDDLQVNDLVVHAEHGIGKYLGLSKIKALNSEGDFALLEYADGDKLYVPVYRLEALNRYIGSPGVSGSLDRLGSGVFAKSKEKVKAAVKDIAESLLRVQAERARKEGYAFSSPDDQYRSFEAEFPFDETPDQEKAIQETLDDMCSPHPMDRLICGDVGFGKTEVAIRAAFKAAQDGKQVAVLVPTTILAEQHYLSFSQRIGKYAAKVASLSRFRSAKEQTAIVQELAQGKIDVIIGTHRLLSKDVVFKDLGLLIIDEEQRFGVEHKEKLKQIKATTDVLTLTATPIPRTFQMALMGIKDVSIIQTPPGDRLKIKTYISAFNEELIQSAVRMELSRGGQVFFIHNRVQNIHQIAEIIHRLVPEAKCVVAHGQMPETQLEKAMIGFYQKEFDVLIATAIIENGLDVPNANTLIVNRADTFGLSQLYQIRGRVGRSQTRAYAYMLLPENGLVTGDAKERLSVLQRFTELGSGYSVAAHDLEIRGGGDILGQAQSGHIASVGYEMYLELLQEEVLRQKGHTPTKKLEEVEINVPISALLPQDYVPDMKARLGLYRKLSSISSEELADDAQKELEDRYGELPKEAHELLWILRLKVLMRRMGFKALTMGPRGLSISPGMDPLLEPAMVLGLVATQPKRYAVLPEGKFVIYGKFESVRQVYNEVRQLQEGVMQ